jgi:hypothetical protein
MSIPPASLRTKLPFLLPGLICLLLAVAGGLWRLGLDLPLPDTQPATFHGALMIAAFFGTVIGLERAVESGLPIAYLAPLGAGGGGLIAAFGLADWISGSLLLMSALIFVSIAARGWLQTRTGAAAVALGGALCLLAANGLWWWGWLSSDVVGFWLAFLVLTIVAERMQLAPHPLRCLSWLTAGLVAGAALLPFEWRPGTIVMGCTLALIALCLLWRDEASRQLRSGGLTGFTAICLVSGYLWLGLGGILLPFAASAGLGYDAALHAILLGFVFAMVFGHAPLVFPTIIGRPIPYTPLFFTHLLILQASLILRLSGDLLENPDIRLWGGIGNAAALAIFFLLTVGAMLSAHRQHGTTD